MTKKTEKTEEPEASEEEQPAEDESSGGAGAEEGAEATESTKEPAEKYVEVQRNKKIALKVDIKSLGILPIDRKQIFESKRKIREMDRLDAVKFETEEARNTLETFVYALRNQLSDEDDEIQMFTNSEEKETVMEALSEVGDWVEEEGEDATLQEIKAKSKYLHSKTDPITVRRYEYENRDKALMDFASSLFRAQNETSNITNSHEVDDEEYAEFTAFLQNMKEETIELYRQQKELRLDEDPLFRISDLEAKVKDIEKRVKKFKYRPRRKPKIEATVETATANEKKSDQAEGNEQNESAEPKTQEENPSSSDQASSQETLPDEL